MSDIGLSDYWAANTSEERAKIVEKVFDKMADLQHELHLCELKLQSKESPKEAESKKQFHRCGECGNAVECDGHANEYIN